MINSTLHALYANGTDLLGSSMIHSNSMSFSFPNVFAVLPSANWLVIKQVAYISVGGLSSIANCLLTASIVRHRALRQRKEYIVVCGLAMADLAEGMATLLAGVYRLAGIQYGWIDNMVSPLACMALPSHLLWRWSDQSTALMLLAVSVDRLFAVSRPLIYYRQDQVYALKLVGTIFFIALLCWCFVWPYPIANSSVMVSALCTSTDVISPLFYQFSKYSTAVFSGLSVVVYGLVIAFLQKRTRQLKFCTDSYTQKRQAMAQWKLTGTLGISSLLTLLLDSLPRAIGMKLYMNQKVDPTDFNLAPYCFLMTKINAMANVVVFGARQPEIRHGIRHLCDRSSLPEDLNLWDVRSRIGSDPRVNPNRKTKDSNNSTRLLQERVHHQVGANHNTYPLLKLDHRYYSTCKMAPPQRPSCLKRAITISVTVEEITADAPVNKQATIRRNSHIERKYSKVTFAVGGSTPT